MNEAFELLFLSYRDATRGDLRMAPYLNFAWELDQNDISLKSIKRAKDIIERTDYLVVIGYSFPNFNRLIDREILKNSKSLRKIYYQAPSNVVESLSQRIKGVLPTGLQPLDATPITDLDQFFIPYEL